MTISISDSAYSSRYNWRSQTNNRPMEESIGVADILAPTVEPVRQQLTYEDAVDRYYDNGTASLAAALWEMESARAAKASQQMATVEPDAGGEEQRGYNSGAMPTEILRRQILQSMGLTEGDIAQMLPPERSSIENRIDSAIQQQRLASLSFGTF